MSLKLVSPAPATAQPVPPEKLQTNIERQLHAAGFIFKTDGSATCFIDRNGDHATDNPDQKLQTALAAAATFGIQIEETNDEHGNVNLRIVKAA